MRIDAKMILIAALIATVIALILARGCNRPHDAPDRIDVQLIYDSITRVVRAELPSHDTIYQIKEREVVRWQEKTVLRFLTDTFVLDKSDTVRIVDHFVNDAVIYEQTLRDSLLEATIRDTIYQNTIVARDFRYKILKPVSEVTNIYKPDRFQLIASFQTGAAIGYDQTFQGIYVGVDLGLKFKTGTYFSLGYMAGSDHFATIRAGQVIRFKKRTFLPHL